ncbi:hypothetical protein D3C71_1219450 [compost metagenome]
MDHHDRHTATRRLGGGRSNAGAHPLRIGAVALAERAQAIQAAQWISFHPGGIAIHQHHAVARRNAAALTPPGCPGLGGGRAGPAIRPSGGEAVRAGMFAGAVASIG